MEDVTLRQAQKEDLIFLFTVSTRAMQPVVEALKSVLQKLVEESDKLGIPIILEVHDVNRSAKLFYQKFGFALVKTIAGKSTLQYLPILM